MRTYRGKYGAKKVESYGMSFASKGERSTYEYLKYLELAGEIKVIQAQDHVYLSAARILYIPDFKIFDVKLNKEVWIEFKGVETPVWRIKRRLWIHYGPGLLRVYKKTGRSLSMTEELVPIEQEQIKP